MSKIREPVVAGMFYPGNKEKIETTIQAFLSQVKSDEPVPKAIIAPHAGYEYSGLIAASAYACLKHADRKIEGDVA